MNGIHFLTKWKCDKNKQNQSKKNSLNVRERHRGKQTNKHKYREKQQQQIDAKFHWKLTKVKINVHRGNHTPSKRFSNRIQFQKSMLSLSMKMKREKNEEKKTKRGRLLRIVHSLIGSTLVIKWDWNVYYLASMELVHPEMIKKKNTLTFIKKVTLPIFLLYTDRLIMICQPYLKC